MRCANGCNGCTATGQDHGDWTPTLLTARAFESWHILWAGAGMIGSYFKPAYRRLSRDMVYTLLNTAGLAVGIAAALLIFLIVRFERSFDDFHPSADRIYRVVSVPFRAGSPLGPEPGAPLPVAKAIRTDFASVEKAAAIFGSDGQVTIPAEPGLEKKMFDESGNVYYAEPDFFSIFHFPWLSGDPRTLADPGSVALSRETAIKYFGDWQTAIGRKIQFGNKTWFKVTGILADPPSHTDFPLEVVLSYTSLTNVDLTDWGGVYGRGYTFVRLRRGTDVAVLDRSLHDFVDRRSPAGRERRGLMLQPLARMHQDGNFGTFTGRTFSGELSRSLVVTAIVLLVIACVNFINLATAQAVKRSRETDIRKILGSSRFQLVLQFLVETAAVVVTAVIVATCLADLAVPSLNDLLGTTLKVRLDDTGLREFLALITIVTILLAGIYPALRLSGGLGFRITGASRGGVSEGGSSLLRRGLVVTQFCAAQVLTICVLVVSGQMNFFRNAPVGFDKTSVVNIPIPGDSVSQRRMDVVRQELLGQPGVESVCFSTYSPLDDGKWTNQFKFDHSAVRTDFQTYFKWADAGFFSTYRPDLIAGRAYDQSDTVREYVVNETLVKRLGLRDPKDILGKEINFFDELRGPVVGVVRDFHTSSMQNPIEPIVLACWKESYGMAGIRLRPGDTAPALAAIARIWRKAYPDYIYSYQFLNDKIDAYYKQEATLSDLYRVFAGIAILISCLGLYGLISFMAEQRTREIGVRKVLGASVPDVILLLSREFTILIVVAFIVAAPIAWLLMHRWLDGFAYRIHPGVAIFMAAFACSILIAWATVGYRAFIAAVANPVAALRSE